MMTTELLHSLAQDLDVHAIPPLLGNDTTPPEVRERIARARAALGDRVLILGHHYQRDEVIAFADRRGDSLDLSIFAAQARDVEHVVFCGVHFMAETADILTPAGCSVILPDMRAGCSMADMAAAHQVEECWETLSDAAPGARIVPITYINSTAALKAFCGRNGGAVCTSSNAGQIVARALAQGDKLLFFPDQHLGRNTCAALGIALDDMVVYDPHQPNGGHDDDTWRRARAILWRGHCSVHMNFKPSHIDVWRQRRPDIHVIVHPECAHEVVLKADASGSTKFILETVTRAEPGTAWAVGTEHHMVNRLRAENPDKFVTALTPYACQCSTMYRISPEALATSLEALAAGAPINVVKVDEETARWATIALERMLEARA